MLGGAEQRREARAAVEPGHAPPVDRAVARRRARRCGGRRGGRSPRAACSSVRHRNRRLERSRAQSGPSSRRGAPPGRDAARYADDDTLRCRRRRQRRQGRARRPRHRAADGRDTRRDAATRDTRRSGGVRSARSSARFDTDGPIGCTLPAVVMDGVVRTARNIDHGVDRHRRARRCLATTTRATRATVLNDADAAASPRSASARRATSRASS